MTETTNKPNGNEKNTAMSYLVHKMMCVFALTPLYDKKTEQALVSDRKTLFESMKKKASFPFPFPFSHDEYMSGPYKALTNDKFDLKNRVSQCNMI